MALTERFVTSAGSGTHDGTSEANALSWPEALAQINAGGAAGTRFNVRGAIAGGGADAITGSGTAASPVIVRGYGVTPGDGYQGRTGGHGALVTTHMPTIAYGAGTRLNITGNWLALESLRVTGSYAGSLLGNGPALLVACRAENAGSGGSTMAGGRAMFSDLINTGAGSRCIAGNSATLYGCCLQFTLRGVEAFNAGVLIVHCAASGGEYLVWLLHPASSATLIHCTGYGLTGGLVYEGAVLTGLSLLVLGCHVTDSGRLVDGAATAVARLGNRTRDNASPDAGTGDWPHWYAVTTDPGGPASDYVDAGAGDLRLLAAAAGVGSGPFGTDLGALPHLSGGGVILVEE